MIWTVDNTHRIGKTVKRVVDAFGTEYDKTISVDTETGEIVKQCWEDGYPVHDENGQMKLETVWAVAPITVEFYQ